MKAIQFKGTNYQNIIDEITGIEFYKDVKLYERERDYISFDIDR